MQDPNSFLAYVLMILGAVGLVVGVAMAVKPAAVWKACRAFPRAKWPGWFLTAVCLFWAVWILQHAALGRFSGIKPFLPYLGILLFAAVVWALDELLSARALGAVLILLADPVLDGIRWADSNAHYVVAVIAYAWVIMGCLWMLYPWLLRKWLQRLAPTAGSLRGYGVVKAAAGIGLLAWGLALA